MIIKNILKEFKEFAVKGDVVDMGVGIVVGAAFTSIVTSLVKDVLSPVLTLITAGVNSTNWFIVLKEGTKGSPYTSLIQAQTDGAVTVNIGLFLNSVTSFLISVFLLFTAIKVINRLRRPKGATEESLATKECPKCFSAISIKANRCPFCTSELERLDNQDK